MVEHKKAPDDLSPSQIKALNILRELESECAEKLQEVSGTVWASRVKSYVETGFMNALKAVARPNSPW